MRKQLQKYLKFVFNVIIGHINDSLTYIRGFLKDTHIVTNSLNKNMFEYSFKIPKITFIIGLFSNIVKRSRIFIN